MDNVKCTWCGFDGLVQFGEETCPDCKQEGFLAWKEGQPQEVSEG